MSTGTRNVTFKLAAQVLEGKLEVMQMEVEELGAQVKEAVPNWSLEELRRPFGRVSSLNQQLQHLAALRWNLLSVTLPERLWLLLTLLLRPGRGQRLQEALQLHLFMRESSEMEDWMNQQRQTAESQELGNDYQHVQVSEPRERDLHPSRRRIRALHETSCVSGASWEV